MLILEAKIPNLLHLIKTTKLVLPPTNYSKVACVRQIPFMATSQMFLHQHTDLSAKEVRLPYKEVIISFDRHNNPAKLVCLTGSV